MIRSRVTPMMAIAAGLLACLLLVAGCGGSGDSNDSSGSGDTSTASEVSTSSTPLTKAEFRKQAVALCNANREKYGEDAFKELFELKREGDMTLPEMEEEIISTLLVERMEQRLDEVRALGIPAGDEDKVEEIFALVEDVIEEAKTNPKRYISLQARFKHPYNQANELAKKYGISACARA